MEGLENVILRIAGVVEGSITDGPGIRYTLFVQGCPHHCEGCHNPETHDPEGGKEVSAAEILAQINGSPLTKGVTFSGGEPFAQAKALSVLGKAIKESGKELAVYSGYTFEQLIAKNDEDINALLAVADVLVDGRFVLKERTLAIPFMGSRNQRIINLPESLAASSVVLETSERWHPIKY